ncbi:hypothetical protein [Gilvimarinus japonicus]|uniref:hypothetical protein n=1 Tax=Gilvimarinus japonicus TaxID=1796469 RepID=UPI0036F27F51
MKKVLAFIILVPSICLGQNISSIYWSYGCDGYIYHFSPEEDKYQIYTKLQVKDKKSGDYYNSYQMTEGQLVKSGKDTYSLINKDMPGKATIDFSDMELAVLSSDQYGQARLWPCDKEKAELLIKEANAHFKVCDKNTLNCTSL